MKKAVLVITIILLVFEINLGYSQVKSPEKVFNNVTKKTIHSNILNEDRVLYVYSPKGDANAKYPVIYMLDGRRSRAYGEMIEYCKTNPHIIVGITNNGNRYRDMYPIKISSLPGSGGADQFLNFISIELKSFIDKTTIPVERTSCLGHPLQDFLLFTQC